MNSIGRSIAQDTIDTWIDDNPQRGSFIDIGGIGEYSTNERCTWAYRCGYQKVAMADFESFDHYLWRHYNDVTEASGITGIEKMDRINVDDPKLPDKIGMWDVVHSTGILYHVPNPIYTISNYRKITRRDLIINTVVIPERVVTESGELIFPQSSVVFLPALEGLDRSILQEYYKTKFGWDLNQLAPSSNAQGKSLMPHVLESGALSYYPYWWLFTVKSFESAVRLFGFEIVERSTWQDHAHAVWLRVAT